MDFIPYPSETQYLAFLRAYYLDLFPKLLDQSQFNRRARDLCHLVERFRRHCLAKMHFTLWEQCLLDTKPVPVVGYRRSKKQSDFLGSADYIVFLVLEGQLPQFTFYRHLLVDISNNSVYSWVFPQTIGLKYNSTRSSDLSFANNRY